MKVPASTPEKTVLTKSQPLPVPPPEPGPRRSEEREYEPRYVALPRRRERGQGQRNLVGGVALFVFAALLLGWAIYLAGPGALLTVATCLATALLLHVMARSRLFRQRNGGLVAWAGVALFGVVLVILHHGWLFMAGGAPPLPGSGTVKEVPNVTQTAPVIPNLPLLRNAFPIKGDVSGPAIRITKDVPVMIQGKSFLAKAGDIYPLLDTGIDEYHFLINDRDVAVPKVASELAMSAARPGAPEEMQPPLQATAPPMEKRGAPTPEEIAVGFTPPNDLAPKDQVLASQREAMRRYPDLAQKGSDKNYAFASAQKELIFSGETDFFKDSNWPLILAENLAYKDGWKRVDSDDLPKR